MQVGISAPAFGQVGGGTQYFTPVQIKYLVQLSGQNPGSSAQGHHIFPVKFLKKFNAAGINIHNPAYGTWWSTTSHLQNAAAYNSAWQQYFMVNPSASQQQIFNFARQIMQRYGF